MQQAGDLDRMGHERQIVDVAFLARVAALGEGERIARERRTRRRSPFVAIRGGFPVRPRDTQICYKWRNAARLECGAMPQDHHRDPRRGGRGARWRPRARRTARAQPSEASASKPHVVLLVLDEFPGDSLLDRARADRPGALPELRRAGRRLRPGSATPTRLRLDHQGGAADPRRHAPAARHGGRPQRPPALDLRHVRAPRLPDRRLRGGLGALPAVDLPRRAHARGRRSSPTCSAAARSASTAGCARSGRQADALGKHLLLPHGPYLYLPSGAQTRARAARPAARDEHRAGLPRRVPHAPQRAALPAAARLRRPPARPAAAPAQAGRASTTTRWSS